MDGDDSSESDDGFNPLKELRKAGLSLGPEPAGSDPGRGKCLLLPDAPNVPNDPDPAPPKKVPIKIRPHAAAQTTVKQKISCIPPPNPNRVRVGRLVPGPKKTSVTAQRVGVTKKVVSSNLQKKRYVAPRYF